VKQMGLRLAMKRVPSCVICLALDDVRCVTERLGEWAAVFIQQRISDITSREHALHGHKGTPLN